MPELGRLLTAMVTPFQANGEVDYAKAKALALALLDSGSDGLVVAGTTGESPTLTSEEKLKLFSEIRKAVGSRGSVIAGTGSNDTRASIELTKAAEATGADAALLVVPYYNKPTQDGLLKHFSAIAEKTRLPCILYNVPGRTITSLAAETTIKLSEVPNIIGIKEASGDLKLIGAIIDGVKRKDFRVWSGNDSDTYAIMKRGGYGVIAVASHIAGKQMREMIRLCVDGQYPQAEAIHNRLTPLFRDLFVVANPIPVKYALNKIGFGVGPLRLPLSEPDAKAAAVIEAMLKQTTIDLPVLRPLKDGKQQPRRLLAAGP